MKQFLISVLYFVLFVIALLQLFIVIFTPTSLLESAVRSVVVGLIGLFFAIKLQKKLKKR